MAYTVKVATGIYTGNGTVQEIAACNGADWVWTKRITGTVTSAHAMWERMRRNACNGPGGTLAAKSSQITDLTPSGFLVGAGQSQNSAIYAYIAMKALGSKYFQTGRYVGDAADNRNLTGLTGTVFQPDLVGLHQDVDGFPGVFRTSEHVGDLAQTYTGAGVANYIQSLLSTGFQIGTNANVNTSAAYFNWYAMRKIPGALAIGSFTGTGAEQDISVGFQPTAILIKNQSTTDAMVMATSAMLSGGYGPHPVSAAASDAQTITALTSGGFSVGTAAAANGLGNKMIWIALRDGEYSPAGAR